MIAIFAQLDAILRGGRGLGDRPATLKPPRLRTLLLAGFVASFLYGAVMGTFGLAAGGERALQVVFSGLKVPLLLLVTFGLCVPSFFVANTLAGLRDDFAASLRALLVTQCALAVVLVSFSPLTALWYLSDGSYDRAILFNAVMFGVASLAAQRVLFREYRPLIARNPRHRWMVRLWLAVYAFVGIQMGWVLRPFVGKPGLTVRFFRTEAWGNAYQQVIDLISKQLGG